MQLERVREFQFTDDDFSWIRGWMLSQTGIALGTAKQDLIYNRLVRRLRTLGLRRFSEYRGLLDKSPVEQVEFVNALTTNVTSFFREEHHFAFLADELRKRAQRSRRIRIWSAGCSSGEEPYSIAMTVVETLGTRAAQHDVRILATDLDTNMVETGRAGVYPIERVEELGQRVRFFRRGTGAFARQARAAEELRDLVTFRQLNLMQEPWPFRGPFDFIFCRNVVIYFERATQKHLFERYWSLLGPAGCLFLGHSESLGGAAERFETVGRTVHRRPT